MAVTGKMHCQTCGQRVTAKLTERPTRLLCSVTYPGHTGTVNGKKVPCKEHKIKYGEKDFPQWAYNAVKHLPLGT